MKHPSIIIVFLVATSLTFWGKSAEGDALVTVKAVSAPTIAEIFVNRDSVRVEIEISEAAWPVLLSLLSESLTPNTLTAEALQRELEGLEDQVPADFFSIESPEGDRLAGQLLAASLGRRIARDNVTGDPLVIQPEDAPRVVRLTLDFPITDSPRSLMFLAPRVAEGVPQPSIGFVCYHEGVPVNDFRYLPATAMLSLDSTDPWYSSFERKNLGREYDAPVSVFLYVEPFEVRKEIILRPRDLSEWTDLDLGESDRLSPEKQERILEQAGLFLQEHGTIKVDGKAVEGTLDRIHFVERTLKRTGVVAPGTVLSRDAATLGAIFVYPIEKLPDRVTLDWDLFSGRVAKIPSACIDEAGPLPAELTPNDSQLVWKNYLLNPTIPAMQSVPIPPANAGKRIPWTIFAGLLIVVGALILIQRDDNRARVRSVGIAACISIIGLLSLNLTSLGWLTMGGGRLDLAALGPEQASEVTHALLTNIYRSFDRREEKLVYDRLSQSAAGDLLSTLYLEIKQDMELESQGGARVRVDTVELESMQLIEPESDTGFRAQCQWLVAGSVGHWGHLHTRSNRYQATLDVDAIDGAWKLTRVSLEGQVRLGDGR